MDAAARAKALLWSSYSFLEEAEYYFYCALVTAGNWDTLPAGDRQSHLDILADHHRELQVWADLCPQNFASHAALVDAEIARIAGREIDAEMRYEQAIHAARDNGFLNIEALANELASRFYAARGLQKIARSYLRDARYGYLRWGRMGRRGSSRRSIRTCGRTLPRPARRTPWPRQSTSWTSPP